VDKEEVIKCRQSFVSGPDCRNFFEGYFNVSDWVFFHNLVHISGKAYCIFMKILSLVKKVLVEFCCKSSESGLQIPTIFTLREVCAVQVHLFIANVIVIITITASTVAAVTSPILFFGI